MAATGEEINDAMKSVLKKDGFKFKDPPKKGMKRRSLKAKVFAAVKKQGLVTDAEKQCVHEAVDILLLRHEDLYEATEHAAIRRVKKRLQYWRKKGEHDEDPDTSRIRCPES